MKKILFLTHTFPFPPKDGFRIRVFNFIKHLSRYYDITVLSFIKKKEKKYISNLSLYCDVFTVDRQDSIFDMTKNIGLSFASKKPLLALSNYSKVFENKLKVLLKRDFDFVFFEGLQSSQYLGCIKGSATVLDMHYPEHIILKNAYDVQKNKFKRSLLKTQLEKVKNYELSQVKRFDKVFTCSEKDAYNIGMANFYNGFVVPNGCTIYNIDFIFKPNLLFVGSLDYLPNEDGLLWFLDEVFPKIIEEFPDIIFYIIGRNPSEKIKGLESKNIKVLGFVEDLIPYYNKSSLFIVPLRISGGTRLKIQDAMSFKKCVVSTRIGAENLDVEDNKNIFLVDDSERFTNKIIGLLRNPSIAKDVAEKGYDLVKNNYDWRLIVEKVRKILENK